MAGRTLTPDERLDRNEHDLEDLEDVLQRVDDKLDGFGERLTRLEATTAANERQGVELRALLGRVLLTQLAIIALGFAIIGAVVGVRVMYDDGSRQVHVGGAETATHLPSTSSSPSSEQ